MGRPLVSLVHTISHRVAKFLERKGMLERDDETPGTGEEVKVYIFESFLFWRDDFAHTVHRIDILSHRILI